MQIKTKLGLVDIPNEVIMAAARDIAGSADSTPVIAAPSGSLCTGDLVHRLGEIAAAAPFGEAEWNRTLQGATMALRGAIQALEDIERDASGALNNAFPEEAPDIVANLQARAAKSLKALSSVNNGDVERRGQ